VDCRTFPGPLSNMTEFGDGMLICSLSDEIIRNPYTFGVNMGLPSLYHSGQSTNHESV
jgi:hypothetical protein